MSHGVSGSCPKVRCAVYTRKSSEEGLDQAFNSLDAQREACSAYVLSQAGEGWTQLSTRYDDGGYSGGTMERPALRRLLADIAACRVDVVVVYKVDRLTRSLGDFARIVDTFDQAGASFVSVTQAFNTTNSMGRLTLNMLLSFAQFEREVTGERIRDKIAASKRRGMWMGGNIALGYAPDGRTLVVNEGEAATVQHIFQRYLILGSVEALRAELTAGGYVSKSWTSTRGNVRGGVPFGRGALFHLLSNRLYLGEVPHKGKFHPGLHPAIVDREVFDQVQRKLAASGGPKRRAREGLPPLAPAAPLAGLIRDDRGNPMSPVNARRQNGRCYRYYVSSAAQLGRSAEAGSLSRVPAAPLEALVLDRAKRLSLMRSGSAGPNLRDVVVSIEVAKRRVRIVLRREVLDVGQADLTATMAALPSEDQLAIDGDTVILDVPAVLQRRGGMKLITRPDGRPAVERKEVDRVLLKALVRAEAWKRALVSGEASTLQAIAAEEGVQAAYAARLLRLAFLAPELKRAILDGRQSACLTLQRVMERGLPTRWADQLAHLH
jgi:DNA invertase Pin-like site-specific DNA recombinase